MDHQAAAGRGASQRRSLHQAAGTTWPACPEDGPGRCDPVIHARGSGGLVAQHRVVRATVVRRRWCVPVSSDRVDREGRPLTSERPAVHPNAGVVGMDGPGHARREVARPTRAVADPRVRCRRWAALRPGPRHHEPRLSTVGRARVVGLGRATARRLRTRPAACPVRCRHLRRRASWPRGPAPTLAVRGVLDVDAGRSELVAQGVATSPVPLRSSCRPSLE